MKKAKKENKQKKNRVVANFGFIIAVKRQKIDGQRGLKRNNYYTSHTQRGNYPAMGVMPSQQFSLNCNTNTIG